tara:strand:+ start:46 stop:636 length:591 start_codon:yes stop_codon:yes gene_type:complete
MKKQYHILSNVVSKEVCEFLETYFIEKEQVAKLYLDSSFISKFNKEYGHFNDPQLPGTYAIYGSLAGDLILKQLKLLVEKTIKKKLYEMYSYTGVFNTRNSLQRQKGEVKGAVSAVLNLSKKEWPIHIKHKALVLKLGDMIVYQESVLEHWRLPLVEGKCVQLFLHYIDVKAKNSKKHKYDSRPRLGVDKLIQNGG